MTFDARSIVNLLIGISVFGLIFAIWSAVVLIWSRRRAVHEEKVERRLSFAPPEVEGSRVLRLWHDGKETTTSVPERSGRTVIQRLDQQFIDAGWNIRSGPLLFVVLPLVTLTFAASSHVFLSNALLGVGIVAAGVGIFWTYMKHCISRQASLFERQLVDALELAARSLRAGHPLIGAFSLISEEIAPPIGTLFAEICQQQELGVGLERSIQQEATNCSNSDMKLFATSVVIQLRTGGNLADMMDRVAVVIRERMRLNRRVRTLTAQTQFSKRILLMMPVVVFVILNLIKPSYMEPLYATDMGKFLLAAGAGGMLLGAWTMNRLAVLKY